MFGTGSTGVLRGFRDQGIGPVERRRCRVTEVSVCALPRMYQSAVQLNTETFQYSDKHASMRMQVIVQGQGAGQSAHEDELLPLEDLQKLQDDIARPSIQFVPTHDSVLLIDNIKARSPPRPSNLQTVLDVTEEKWGHMTATWACCLAAEHPTVSHLEIFRWTVQCGDELAGLLPAGR